MNRLGNIILIALLILFVSCEKEGFFSAGKTVTQRVELSESITEVTIKSMFEVTLVQDTENYALVTCGKNLQPEVKLSSNGNALYLTHSITFNWTRRYEKVKVELHLKSLPSFTIHKPVLIKTQGLFTGTRFYLIDWEKYTELDVELDVETLQIDVSSENFGLYKLRGKAKTAVLYGWGSSRIEAQNMVINQCFIGQRSIDDIYVNVQDNLTVSIESSGDVYYTGNPAVTYTTTSTGRLVKR